ncbi:glycerol-3-phosphate dehydrogenase, mitochondrial-like [Hydractinia symbiolongicarpus]|uniref:glycerol-3-phosphate dehydrogenase, mitochondrial-like n=1 Tax=Hydractinia symbiolongicarpus TaxID=13093 RepID=UPI00254C29DE|nr:glycerol-3-phosphate dehydrogenase, mitochondrial-like [Hydractinia symbiolongicarpus]
MNRVAAKGIGLGICVISAWTVKSYLLDQGQLQHVKASPDVSINPYQTPLPSRSDLLTSLKDRETEYDVLVIGGGATGCGVALDACSRGLKTALVEKYDYSAGTSSRSTKLIHGGVRYLQKAIMKLDREQYRMVKEALHERANLLAIAPHIATPLPIMLPVYKWWQVPYFWVGIKMYDLVAGRQQVKSSYFMGKRKALESFPMLKSENLCGAIIYYDGQQDDSRMNLAIAMTAIRKGATCVNHVEVTRLLFKKDDNNHTETVCGAHIRDTLTGEEWDVKAKCVVNATGPFTDAIRKLDNKESMNICQPASGVHVVLPDYYCPKDMGLLDPSTSDGRVIFFLPWEGKTIVGTTDKKCDVTYNPEPSEEEIQFILNEVKRYVNPDIQVRRGDVLSAWSGIRPLVVDPSSADTQSISRNHMINVSDSKLVTIAGGKWTTYRSMAQDTVDTAVKACNLNPSGESATDGALLEGAEGWTPTYYLRLVQDYGFDPEVAIHLSHAYGVNAPQVARVAALTGNRWPVIGRKLCDDHPYIEAEVLHSVRREYACTATDMIARRLRVAFLDTQAAESILPTIVQIMGDELKWDNKRRKKEIEEANKFLLTMASNHHPAQTAVYNVDKEDMEKYAKVFQDFDSRKKGHITRSELSTILKRLGKTKVSDTEVERILKEIDLDASSTIEFNEFLHLMMCMKTGVISNNALGILVNRKEKENIVL